MDRLEQKDLFIVAISVHESNDKSKVITHRTRGSLLQANIDVLWPGTNFVKARENENRKEGAGCIIGSVQSEA
jgi:hypothetical protein